MLRLLALATLMVASSGSGARAQLVIQDRTYDCQIIARTDEFPRGFVLGAPTMNAWGQVAFVARVDPDFTYELRVGVGDRDAMDVPQSDLIARASTDPFEPGALFGTFVTDPVIDDSARLIFQAQDRADGGPPVDRIYRTPFDVTLNAGPIPYLVENEGANPLSPYLALDSVLGPTINAGDSLLFRANTTSVVRGVFTENGSLLMSDNAGGIQSVEGFWTESGLGGYQAFLVLNSNGTSQQLRLGPSTIVDSSSDTFQRVLGGVSLASNQGPLLAYVRRTYAPPTDGWQLGVYDGVGFVPYVDTAVDPFVSFSEPRATSVNAWGEIAFLGRPLGDGETLLVADGVDAWRVHCDDMLGVFGRSSFFEYELSSRAFNAEGEIAFRARTSELIPGTSAFRTFIVRASPRPGEGQRPMSCIGLADDTPCDDGDPETISACAAQICVGDPLNRPQSCVGLPDGTPCDDGVPDAPGFCAAQVCVAVPVPEPDGLAAKFVALAALGVVGRRRARRGDAAGMARSASSDRAD
ncbi:MAG TPA: hypothetical protein PLW10_16175 [Myxococcota bacterium]|nr:hypothetical protein [Myxococcota bacterium]